MTFANVLLVSGSANFSTRDVWDGYRIALEAEGVRVIPYPTFSYLKVLSVDAVCNDILGTALDVSNEIDAVVFVDGLFFRGPRSRLPLSLRRAGMTTVLIATDDPYEPIPNLESLYNYRFTNEIHCVAPGTEYLPTATLPQPIVPRVDRPQYDISFLGTVFEDRLPLIKAIAEHCEVRGYHFLIAGKVLGDWEQLKSYSCTDIRLGTINNVDKWDIYSQSRITLNIFRSSERPADSPSPRVFEVTAFGQAALLSGPERSEVRRIYGDSILYFDNTDSALSVIDSALKNPQDLQAKAAEAQAITLASQLYEHRAQQLIRQVRKNVQQTQSLNTPDEQLAWIIGCGRTGSTWLAEMLGSLSQIRRWHEPYFGRFLKHLADRPDEQERKASFFFQQHQDVWVAGLRDIFYRMAADRFPNFGKRHALVVKEVNTPELCPWLRKIFPLSRLIFLVRDPYDVLDSYLDMQQPGGWNEEFAISQGPTPESRAQSAAQHIRSAFSHSLRTFEDFPLNQRAMVYYEDLLAQPAPSLRACADLMGVEVAEDELQKVIEQNSFSQHEQTGSGQFRRFGKAGSWSQSQWFTTTVREIADEILGPLRRRLGYENENAD